MIRTCMFGLSHCLFSSRIPPTALVPDFTTSFILCSIVMSALRSESRFLGSRVPQTSKAYLNDISSIRDILLIAWQSGSELQCPLDRRSCTVKLLSPHFQTPTNVSFQLGLVPLLLPWYDFILASIGLCQHHKC